MVEREEFCKSFITDDKSTFDDMSDVINVDEKWLYMTKNTKKFYLGMQEHEVHSTTRSKWFSTKVMFLAAVVRPRWDSINNKYFDGKLGIWPLTIIETTKRKCRNCTAWMLVMKSMDSITADQYCDTLMYHVVPAIKTKWPGNLSDTRIKIQQDNARPHIEPSDEEFLCKTFEMGLKVDL